MEWFLALLGNKREINMVEGSRSIDAETEGKSILMHYHPPPQDELTSLIMMLRKFTSDSQN